jgi:hypothetical protein
MRQEICTISIGQDGLNDDYTFYENGRVHRYFTSSLYGTTNKEWIGGQEITKPNKEKLRQACDAEFLAKIERILFL